MTNNIFTKEIDETIVSFRLRDFLKKQREIHDKFPIPTIDNQKYEKFDKLLLNIIEEIFEVKSASTVNETIDEVIDILMYLGSLHSIFIDDEYEVERVIHFNLDYENIFFDHNTLFKNLNEIENKLIAIRREFPERKWHKEFNKEDINLYERDCKVVCILKNIILEILSILFNFTMRNSKEPNLAYFLSEKINKKQNFIYNLK